VSGATGSSDRISFSLDPITKVGRTNVKSVAYLNNRDIASAEFIIGRGGIILKDRRGGRTGYRAGSADFERYGATP
jgi:hypothetical protein